jgi:hypothetical protein
MGDQERVASDGPAIIFFFFAGLTFPVALFLFLLGNEQIITVMGLSDVIISRVSTNKIYTQGDSVELFMDVSSFYFFDKESELRII